MNSKERLQTVLSGGIPDRVPYQDAFWETTVSRWHGEGLPQDMTPQEYFGCEMCGMAGDYTLQLQEKILEATERYKVYIDSNGVKRRELSTPDGWTPQWLDFEIKSRDDWDRLKDRATYNPSRLPEDSYELYRTYRRQDKFIPYGGHTCFDPTWRKIGMENLLVWLIEDPDFIYDLFATHTQLMIDIYEGFKELGVEFDGAFLADDLGYRNNPLISPAMYRTQVMPHHRRICEHLAADGVKTILHSDGNVEPLIPDFIEAGFAGLHPLEVKAGLDVFALKEKYGKQLVYYGNIDVRKLAGSREEVEEEIATKVGRGKEGGAYIFHSDHSVPSDVSFANYCYAMEMLKKYGSYA